MDATRAPGDRRFRAFAIKIEPVLPPVCSPTVFKVLYVLGLLDAESQEELSVKSAIWSGTRMVQTWPPATRKGYGSRKWSSGCVPNGNRAWPSTHSSGCATTWTPCFNEFDSSGTSALPV
jgi:hypothetical protein